MRPGSLATSIWQYRQSEVAKGQADSQEAIAKTQAENQWRIERAEILAKNLAVLASRGEGSADQRYGVLLSLTRGEILDPELAVSYALELGKDNAEYMQSVLESTSDKDFAQLAHAFVVTCQERYGFARQVDICKLDTYGPRSEAIARVMSDEAEAWATAPPPPVAPVVAGKPVAPPTAAAVIAAAGPMIVLEEEQIVQKDLIRLAWIFTPAVAEMYQKRLWTELTRFESYSTGAHMIAALLLPGARTGELKTAVETDQLNALHASESKWLYDYIFGKSCEADCRGRFADYLITQFGESQGDFDAIVKHFLEMPAPDSTPFVEKLHTRLARCQVDDDDIVALRDQVTTPLLASLLDEAKPNPVVLDNLIAIISYFPDPTDPPALAAWNGALAKLEKSFPDKHKKEFVERRVAIEAEIRSPSMSLRKVTFCKEPDQTKTPDAQAP